MRHWLWVFTLCCQGLSGKPGFFDVHDTGAPSSSQDPADTDPTPALDTDAPPALDTDSPPALDTDAPPPRRAQRVVIAGDSWSTGFIHPLRAALDDRGMDDIGLSWETTARAGSTARHWLANEHPPGLDLEPDLSQPRMLSALRASLDAEPPADVLLLVLSGNDLNREADEGLGKRSSALFRLTMAAIERDLAGVVDAARDGRPDLQVVLVGYDFFHHEFLTLFGLRLDGFDITSYNEAVIDLETRKRSIADARDGVWWSHHLGLLQHHHGDDVHPPLSRPNPLTGYPTYEAGVAPAPGLWPTYDPMPGGFYTYPAPLDLMPDGIHPSAEGHRVLSDHLLDQGLERLLLGQGWGPLAP